MLAHCDRRDYGGHKEASFDSLVSSLQALEQQQLQQPQQPFLQLLTSAPKLSEPSPPVLSIEEQPAQYHRFRYQSEVEGSRVGGLLLGRHADKDNRSFMKVRISGIDAVVHSSLRLTVCTVSPERAPHPFFLHGDNCQDGYCLLQKTIDDSTGGCWDVIFTRLAVICPPKKNKGDIRKAMETRDAKVPKLHDGPELPQGFAYDSRNLGGIRLAFSLAFIDTAGQSWLIPTVYSDEISQESEKKKTMVDIDCVNPAEVPPDGSSIIAIYTVGPTTGLQKSAIKVIFTFLPENTGMDETFVIERDVEMMKNHLLIVRTPDVRYANKSLPIDRLKCRVSVRYNDTVSKQPLNLLFDRRVQPAISKVSGQALKRSAPA